MRSKYVLEFLRSLKPLGRHHIDMLPSQEKAIDALCLEQHYLEFQTLHRASGNVEGKNLTLNQSTEASMPRLTCGTPFEFKEPLSTY